eukprot:TRINITY_DN781_c0_g1_i3.p1 TRINITY_DN781_c0_g1~~TRINITY_DN781_c0_g1_i3.p1  ORF type:complete len:224 (+),score=31.45 TRINITY_DN781_c0_g1_i3:557-1228(+)
MLVGSIKASEDRPLQSRLVSYFSAHEYRVGTNRHLIPVNKPANGTHHHHSDGQINTGENKGTLIYEPSLVHKTYTDDRRPSSTSSRFRRARTCRRRLAGRSTSSKPATSTAALPRRSVPTWCNLVYNLECKLKTSTSDLIKNTMSHFMKSGEEYGTRVAEAIGADMETVKKMTAALTEWTRGGCDAGGNGAGVRGVGEYGAPVYCVFASAFFSSLISRSFPRV